MLNFRMTELADPRIGLSPRLLPIPGNGSTLLVQTSEMVFSSLMRSIRRGASVGIWLGDMCECDRMTETDEELLVYLGASVFLMITCCEFDLGPSVAARWIESLREKLVNGPKDGPMVLISACAIDNKSERPPLPSA